MENGQKYQLCLIYNSTRSTIECIDHINKFLRKLKLPLLKGIELKPKKNLKSYFYHQDCLINFYCDESYSTYTSMIDFWKNYKKNGMAIVVKDSLDYDYINNLNRLFEEIIYVNKNEDLLAANMIVMKKE